MRKFFVASIVVLTACSGAETAPADTTPAPSPTTTIAVTTLPPTTTTTLPPDEPLVDCPVDAFRAQFKTKMRMLRCTTSWALGSYDRDTWNCGPDGCEDTRVFALRAGTWVNTATCYLDQPLTAKRRRCYVPDVGLAADADLPPSNIACVLWPVNSEPKWIDETGCPLNDEAIDRILSTKCDGWTPNEALPLEPCDSGPMVRKVQRALSDAGYPVQVDGFNGPGTVQAIARYQADKKLRRTGVVDQSTWDSLTAG